MTAAGVREAAAQRTCAAADRTGHAMLHTLLGQSAPLGQFFIEYFAIDLVMDHDGACRGVMALHGRSHHPYASARPQGHPRHQQLRPRLLLLHVTHACTGEMAMPWCCAPACTAGHGVRPVPSDWRPGAGMLITEGARGEAAM